jgi:hypothetical protein
MYLMFHSQDQSDSAVRSLKALEVDRLHDETRDPPQVCHPFIRWDSERMSRIDIDFDLEHGWVQGLCISHH